MFLKLVKVVARFILPKLPYIKFPRLNVMLLQMQGYKVSPRARIYSTVSIDGSIKLVIGDGTYVGHQTRITGGQGSIYIGENCDISDRVGIFCGTHEIAPEGNRVAGKGIGKDIYIDNGVWVGYGALILPGVTVGRMSVIAAGTVVHKDVPPNCVVAGNPMKIVKHLQ